jgi:hypothetical protein
MIWQFNRDGMRDQVYVKMDQGTITISFIRGPKTLGDEAIGKTQGLGSPPLKRVKKGPTEDLDYTVENSLEDCGDLKTISGEFLGNGYLGQVSNTKTVPGGFLRNVYLGQASNMINSLASKPKISSLMINAANAQKVEKCDDAAVLEHLWEEHVFEKSGWADKWFNDQESF